VAHRQKGLLGRKWRIKVRGRRWKREKKVMRKRERECSAERSAGGKERKMRGEEREKG